MFSLFRKKQPQKPALKFIDLNESNGKLFNDMGLDSQKYGDMEKSIFYISKAIELQPLVSDYIENRALVYWEYKKPNLAFLDLEVAIKLGSEKAEILLNKFKKDYDDQLQSKNRFIKLLNEVGVEYLYHMTHLDNLKGIIEHGLLSHNKAHKHGFMTQDISDNTVNNRRSKIHDYVPLYFNPKNPMLFKRRELQDKIVILCINRELLFSNEILITDGNAASSSTNFYNSIDALTQLNWNIIRSEYWNDFVDGKRIRCAEALLPNVIDKIQIKNIYCSNQKSLEETKKIITGQNIPISINLNVFF